MVVTVGVRSVERLFSTLSAEFVHGPQTLARSQLALPEFRYLENFPRSVRSRIVRSPDNLSEMEGSLRLTSSRLHTVISQVGSCAIKHWRVEERCKFPKATYVISGFN